MKNTNINWKRVLVSVLSVFAVAMIFTTFTIQAATTVKPPAPVSTSTRLVFIGDSITNGVGTNPKATMNYPAQVGRMLGTGWTITNIGVPSATLMDTPKSIRVWRKNSWKTLLKASPDVVVICLGTNDALDKVWAYNTQADGSSKFLQEYRQLIADLKALPTHPTIYIATPPPLSPKKFDTTRAVGILKVVNFVHQISVEDSIPLVDFNAKIPADANFFSDRWHPNNAGAEIMARAAYEIIAGKPFEGAVPLPPAKKK